MRDDGQNTRGGPSGRETSYVRERRGEMAIVIIHWRIKPDKKSVTDFMNYWREKAAIKDKSGLIGELLSAPLSQSELPDNVLVEDLNCEEENVDAWHFFNVGLWRDWATFNEQVGRLIREGRQPFEACDRRRIVLEPQEWRMGGLPLRPGTCP